MKVALIGYGYWGPNIARNLNRSKKADLYAICDIDEKNLNKARKLYGDDVKYVKDYHEVIDEVDAYAIALRQDISYPIAWELLSKKKNLFMEKPLESRCVRGVKRTVWRCITCGSYYGVPSDYPLCKADDRIRRIGRAAVF